MSLKLFLFDRKYFLKHTDFNHEVISTIPHNKNITLNAEIITFILSVPLPFILHGFLFVKVALSI